VRACVLCVRVGVCVAQQLTHPAVRGVHELTQAFKDVHLVEAFDDYMHRWLLNKLSTPAFEDDFTKDCHACNVSTNIAGTNIPCPANNVNIGCVRVTMTVASVCGDDTRTKHCAPLLNIGSAGCCGRRRRCCYYCLRLLLFLLLLLLLLLLWRRVGVRMMMVCGDDDDGRR
jgi:hypothetical protein